MGHTGSVATEVATTAEPTARRRGDARDESAGGVAVRFSSVSHSFVSDKRVVDALTDIDLDIQPGEFVSEVGPSGCGKTTLLNMAAGLVAPTQGSVTIGDGAVRGPREDVAYMLARDALFPWRSALDNVVLGLEVRGVEPSARRDATLLASG